MFPRSSNKPMQAAAMRACGLAVDGELLALASASHSGEDFHVTGVRKILAGAGLTEDALQCPPALPMDEPTLWRFLGEGGRPDRVHMNCSGKHAAMLATCVTAGWPTETYRDPDHPLQREIKAALGRLAGEDVAATGVDGCGAPLFAISLTGLARAFRALVLAAPDSAERSRRRCRPCQSRMDVGDEPLRTRSSTRRFPGCWSSPGRKGVQAFALADGRAGAVKMEDGAPRAIPAITVALLRAIGADQADGVDRDALDQIADLPVLGGGQAVGGIRPTLPH